jgi:hypothetical protein
MELMQRAALQGLGLVGDKLKARDEARRHHERTRKSRSLNKNKSPRHHNSPQHRSRGQRSRYPSPRRYNSPRHEGSQRSKSPRYAHDYEDDKKERWGHHALLTEFAGHQYPKDLSYLTINMSMMALRNLGHGYQTTYKQ